MNHFWKGEILTDDVFYLMTKYSFHFLFLHCLLVFVFWQSLWGKCQGIVRGSPCFVALWLQGYVKVIKKKKKAMVQIISDTWIWFVKLQTALLPILLVKISMCIKSMMASSLFVFLGFFWVCLWGWGWGGVLFIILNWFFLKLCGVCVCLCMCVWMKEKDEHVHYEIKF